MSLIGIVIAGSLISPATHAEPTPGKAVTQPEAGEGQAVRTAGWFTLGGAVAALTGSVVLFKRSDEKPAADASPNQVSDRNDSMRREHGAAQILLVAAAVSATAGVSLILFAPRDKTSPHVAVGMGIVTLGANF